MPRPTLYNKQLAHTICNQLINGQSLRAICTSDTMPDKATVFRWLITNAPFRDQYRLARQLQADLLADDILDIADKAYSTGGAIAKANLQIKSRMWLASKLKPKVYGNKPEQQPTKEQPISHITIEIVAPNQLSNNLLKTANTQ